jgi:hypothetical protein
MMRPVIILRIRLLSLFSRAKAEQDHEELRYHLDRQIEDGVAAGMSREDARRTALRTFQDFEQRKEKCRDMRRLNLIDNLAQDFDRPFGARPESRLCAAGGAGDGAQHRRENGSFQRRKQCPSESGGKLRNVDLPDLQDWHDQTRLGSAAILQLARLSGFRRRAGY